MKTNNAKNKGFTLIELLVVIVILGILGTIGFANFRGYFGRALNAERKAAVNTITSIVKVDMAADFSADKYAYADRDAVIAALTADDYIVPSVKDGMCVHYGFTRGALAASSTDNEFMVLSLLDEEDGPNGNPVFGAVNGASEFVDDARTNAEDSALFAEGTVGCGASDGDLDAAAGGDFEWYEISTP